MRQKATVIEVSDDGTALVRVLRSSMCEGCENRSNEKPCACSLLLGGAKEMTVTVRNDLSARAGDDVEIESESSAVLGYAAIVFLLPVVGALVFYMLADHLLAAPEAAWIAAFSGFILSFLPAFFLDRIHRKKKPRIRIISVRRHDNEEME